MMHKSQAKKKTVSPSFFFYGIFYGKNPRTECCIFEPTRKPARLTSSKLNRGPSMTPYKSINTT